MFGIGASYNKTKGQVDTNESSTTASQYSGGQRGGTATNAGPWGPQGSHVMDIWDEARTMYGDYATRPGADRLNQQAGQFFEGEIQQYPQQRAEFGQRWDDLMGRDQAQYGKYQGVIDKILGTSQNNLMQSATDWAQNNPYLEQSVQSAQDNINRQLGIDVGGAHGINRQAAGAGAMSSSRAGVMEGLATSEAARAMGDAELALRSQAFNQGLGVAGDQLGRQQQVAQLLRTDPSASAGVLQGAQDAERIAASDMANLFGAAQDWYTRQEGTDWNRLNNLFGIIGGQQWGQTGTTDQWGTKVGSETSQSQSKTDTTSSGSNFGVKAHVGQG